jgi:signal transduction histidine kinase
MAGAIRRLVAGSSFLTVVSSLLLVGGPGLLFLYAGYRLPELDILPETYPRIVAWVLGGFGLLLGVVVLRVVSADVTIDNPLWSIALATAIGSVAGLGIGLNEALALSQAREAQQARQRAEQRSQELEQTKEELERTVEHLRRSNDRLEEFAYAASHDLQEPLRMVSSYLQLLENRYSDELDEEAREYIDFAVGGADRMRAMVDSLLEYSRVTSRGETREATDAEAVLQDVIDDFELRIEGTDATITVDDELPTVTADPDQLGQIFRNLVSNALEHSGDEPPQVHVSAECTDGECQFAVADEGIGIDPEYHDRIFKVFEQLATDEETSEPGASGIGLSLCRRIVEHHGEDLWVESELGEGATFYFTFPEAETDTVNTIGADQRNSNSAHEN